MIAVERFHRAVAAMEAAPDDAAREKTGATTAAGGGRGGRAALSLPPPNALPLSSPARRRSTTPPSSRDREEATEDGEGAFCASPRAAEAVAARAFAPPPRPPPRPISPASPAVLTPPLPRVPPPPEALALAPPCWLLSLLGGAKAGRSVPTLGSLGAAPPAATAAAPHCGHSFGALTESRAYTCSE